MADDSWSPELPGTTTITSWEPRVMAIIDSRPIPLLIDAGATFSALLEFWRPTKPPLTSIVGMEGTPTQPLMTFPLTCTLGDTLCTHSLLVLPNCSTPILGRDIVLKFQATLTLHPLPLKPQPISPLSSSLLFWVPCFHKPLPTPCPYPLYWWTPLCGTSKTLQSLHIMSQLLLLSRIPLFSQTNLNITFL
jgi:hypothetical protein